MALILPPTQLITQLQENLSFQKKSVAADAAVLVGITQEENPQVLLTRRASQMRHHAGEVSFPGGRREKGDTSNVVVALREAQEETALNPFDVQLLGELPMEKSRSGLYVKPIVGLIPPQPQLIAQPSEIDRIFYVALQDLLTSPPHPYPVKFGVHDLHFPSYYLDEEVVWGLTARIIIRLLRQGLGYKKMWPFLLNPPNYPSKFNF